MPRIQAPDGTPIDFPDTMKDADIESAMGKLYPKQVASTQPTRFDKFASGVSGDILAPPQFRGDDPVTRIVHGVGDNLGRTTQAWHDMFTGNANPETLAEMVPLVGPAAVDAGKALATPGQRWQGLGQAASLTTPAMVHGMPPISEMPLPPAPKIINRVGGALKAISDPEFISHVPGGKMALAATDAFGDAYRRATAPLPEQPGPPRVVRDPGQRGIPPPLQFDREEWKPPIMSSGTVAPPLSPGLPSNRLPGSLDRARYVESLRTPEPIQPRVSQAQRMGVELAPSPLKTAEFSPISSSLPSGRSITPIRFPTAPHSAEVLPAPLTAPESQAVATPPVSASPNPSVTQQYQPSRTNARFDKNGIRIGRGSINPGQRER